MQVKKDEREKVVACTQAKMIPNKSIGKKGIRYRETRWLATMKLQGEDTRIPVKPPSTPDTKRREGSPAESVGSTARSTAQPLVTQPNQALLAGQSSLRLVARLRANLRIPHLQLRLKQQLLRSKNGNGNCSCRDSDVE